MSYVPKYIMKRMVPQDAIKKVDGGGSLRIINMIMPLSADIAPSGNPLDYIIVKVQGEELSKEEMEAIEIKVNENTYTFKNLAEADTIAVGQEVTFVLKSNKFDSLKVGDDCKIEILVPEASVNLAIERPVSE